MLGEVDEIRNTGEILKTRTRGAHNDAYKQERAMDDAFEDAGIWVKSNKVLPLPLQFPQFVYD